LHDPYHVGFVRFSAVKKRLGSRVLRSVLEISPTWIPHGVKRSLPVYENAAYRLEEHGWSKDEIEIAVGEVLRFVGLDGEEER